MLGFRHIFLGHAIQPLTGCGGVTPAPRVSPPAGEQAASGVNKVGDVRAPPLQVASLRSEHKWVPPSLVIKEFFLQIYFEKIQTCGKLARTIQ